MDSPWVSMRLSQLEFHGCVQRLVPLGTHYGHSMGLHWALLMGENPWHSPKASSLGLHYGPDMGLHSHHWGITWHASRASSLGFHYGHSMGLHWDSSFVNSIEFFKG